MTLRLVRKKERVSLTWCGWLVLLVGLSLIIGMISYNIHDFLAINKPLHAPIIVVEGYIPDAVLKDLAEVHKNEIIVCAGLPFEKNNRCSQYDNFADYNAAVLLAAGVDSLYLISAPSHPTLTDRTYTTALAVQQRLNDAGYHSGNLDLVCYGTHARRSGSLYRKAFDPEWEIGAITYSSSLYDHRKWWRNSEGVRAVLYEVFAYLYCLLFFYP